MHKRLLGKSNLQVSEVGLGCWQLGGDFGPITEKTAIEILEAALLQGINFFDTADVYGDGKSESYIGRVLENHSDKILIASKYGRGADAWPDKYSLNGMRDSIRRSLDRLRRDSLDLIQLHCVPKKILEDRAIFDWLRQMQQEGLIKHFGASVETISEALLCVKEAGFTSLQIIFNLLRQRPKEELFKVAVENKVGIIVRLPLASGLLSGKFGEETSFDKSDHRNYNKDGAVFSVGETFSGIAFNTGLKLTNKIERYMPKDLNMAQFSMRWILDHPAVSTIIPGASSALQVAANGKVSDLPEIPSDIHQKLYELYTKEIETHIRCEI